MTIYVIDENNGKEIAIEIETIEWDKKTNICKFTTRSGKTGRVETDYKRSKNNIAISSAVNNESVYGKIIWEE